MNTQTVKHAEIICPHFTEATARESVEKVRKPAFLRKQFKWLSSVPLYIPFWFVDVEMDLQAPRQGTIRKTYTIMVNAITNRGMLLKGHLETAQVQTRAIFMDQEVSATEARETARLEALVDTKRMIKPPPHRVLPGERLVWYPLALVELEVGGHQDIQVFDYYRGGLDKLTMRFFRMKEKLAEKAASRVS